MGWVGCFFWVFGFVVGCASGSVTSARGVEAPSVDFERSQPQLVDLGSDTRPALFERVLAAASDTTRGRVGSETAIELRGPTPEQPEPPRLPRSSLEPPDVQDVVAAHHAEFAGCYEPAASLAHDFVGVVALEFGLDAHGRVGWVQSTRHTEGFDREVVDCVVSTFARLPFAAPQGRSQRGAFSFVFGVSSAER
jgi:hypothetical protein